MSSPIKQSLLIGIFETFRSAGVDKSHGFRMHYVGARAEEKASAIILAESMSSISNEECMMLRIVDDDGRESNFISVCSKDLQQSRY